MLQNHSTLHMGLFDKNELMLPEIQKKLCRISDYLIAKISPFFNPFIVKDVVVVGSLCSYTYSDSSDLDIFVFVEDIVENDPDFTFRILTSINKSLLSPQSRPTFYGHVIDCGILPVSNERYQSKNNYSLLENKWNDKPQRMEYPFSPEELFKEYCKYSAELHGYVKSLEKINNSFLTFESCNALTRHLKRLRDKAFEAKDNSLHREYSLDYNLYRLLKRFGTYQHFDNYIKDSYKNYVGKKYE